MATSTSMVPAKGPMDTIRALFDKAKPAIAEVLPHHLTAERVLRVTLAAVSRTPLLLQCSPQSLLQSVMVAGQLGLEPTGGVLGQAYLVPYRNSKTGKYEAQLIPGYRGLIDLARRSGNVESLSAYPVFANDTFSYQLGSEPKVEHKPTLSDDPGALVAVYAVARLTDCSVPQIEVMSRTQVDRIRSRSKAKDSGPWVTDYEEMARKTVVRRLSKYLPMSVEFATGLQLQDDAERGERTNYGDLVELPSEIIEAEETETTTDRVKAKVKATVEEPPTVSSDEIPFD